MKPIEEIIDFLCEHKLKLTTAESCTAGMLTSLLASVPGCASILDMGFVVYTEQAKHQCLGVNLQTIKLFGLTSEEVAREMAQGALKISASDFSIAITGTAESDDELNGVVCFAYALRKEKNVRVISQTIAFEGERNQVRELAAKHAVSFIPDAYQMLLLSPETLFNE